MFRYVWEHESRDSFVDPAVAPGLQGDSVFVSDGPTNERQADAGDECGAFHDDRFDEILDSGNEKCWYEFVRWTVSWSRV
jgi:hypothetical protein